MGKIFKPSKPKAAPTPPPPPPPPPIPAQDSAVTDKTRKKAMAQMQARGGVSSTVLSDTLGG